MLLRNLPILPKFSPADLQVRKAPKIGKSKQSTNFKNIRKIWKKNSSNHCSIYKTLRWRKKGIERSTIQNLRIRILATWLFWLTFKKTMTAKSVSREMKLKLQTSPINLYCHLISGSTKNSKYSLLISWCSIDCCLHSMKVLSFLENDWSF